MQIFDGITTAAAKEEALKARVDSLRGQGIHLKIGSLVYAEDAGSVLYTRLKKEAAERVGIEYVVATTSLREPTSKAIETLHAYNQDASITGIIIQKPWRALWQQATLVDGAPSDVRQAFDTWWQYQTSQIELAKDVDGLHPQTLAAIKANTWHQEGSVMPATAQAVWEIIQLSDRLADEPRPRIAIIGKSDIVGKPLAYECANQGYETQLFGSLELRQRVASGKALLDFDIVVSATGVRHLITGTMIKPGAVVIDVGEPKPDVDTASLEGIASFVTPVPGGVGPMTVACLLDNAVRLRE
jgi:methylenetetrahydrofolate dehydrogenase (NADP+)/methenyltetrahydrofolate cyclohydrolase